MEYIELEERLMQALTLIDLLIENPTKELITKCRAFIQENDPIQQAKFYIMTDFKGEDELGF